MTSTDPTGAMMGKTTYSWTMVDNIKRDPFEIAGGLDDQKSVMGIGGALASPSTAYLYDWNMLPIGQLLWEKELMSYKAVPAAAGAGDLQPGRHPSGNEEGAAREPMTRNTIG